MHLSDIMIPDPVTIPVTKSIQEALKIMRRHKLSHLIITNEDESLSGIVAKQDVLDYLYNLVANTTGKTYTALEVKSISIKEVMTTNISFLRQDAPIQDAIHLFAKQHISCVPVVNENERLVGIITPHDMFKYFDKK